jgi:hypothetical protein
MLPEPPLEPLGLSVPIEPPLPLRLLLLGGQFAEALVALPGMQLWSVPVPLLPELELGMLDPLLEPLLEPLGIPELLLPPPLELGLVVLPPDCAIAVPATDIIAAATGSVRANRPHSERKRRRAVCASNRSMENPSLGLLGSCS